MDDDGDVNDAIRTHVKISNHNKSVTFAGSNTSRWKMKKNRKLSVLGKTKEKKWRQTNCEMNSTHSNGTSVDKFSCANFSFFVTENEIVKCYSWFMAQNSYMCNARQYFRSEYWVRKSKRLRLCEIFVGFNLKSHLCFKGGRISRSKHFVRRKLMTIP